jgi:hypothetical protein
LKALNLTLSEPVKGATPDTKFPPSWIRVRGNDSKTGYAVIPTLPLTRGGRDTITAGDDTGIGFFCTSDSYNTHSNNVTAANNNNNSICATRGKIQPPSSPLTQRLQLPEQQHQLQQPPPQSLGWGIVTISFFWL